MEFRKMVMITLYAKQKKRHRCTEQTFGLCGRRRGWDILREQHVYYLYWNRSPAQVGCMRQVLGPGALGRPRGIGWRGRWEGGSRWGILVNPWLIHVNVWQSPLKCCEVISLQLIKTKEKKKKKFRVNCPGRPRQLESGEKNTGEKSLTDESWKSANCPAQVTQSACCPCMREIHLMSKGIGGIPFLKNGRNSTQSSLNTRNNYYSFKSERQTS